MRLIIERPVTVITPTTGSAKVKDAIRSVREQTYKNIKHLIVVDGQQFDEAFVENFETEELEMLMPYCISPENTGANGFNGQRIYAAFPHLVNSDYIFFLDQDNWFEPDHVASLVALMEEKQLDWAYSLRKIYTANKQYVAHDNCESLGKWPIYFTHHNPQFLIDTSSFAFKRSFIQQTCHLWHSGPWGEDRRYFYAIKDMSKWNTTCDHTLCYRLDGNPDSVKEEFFIEGNEKQKQFYNGVLPWAKT
jgi:glycosyltransferase involved in cell wall biosynthesis